MSCWSTAGFWGVRREQATAASGPLTVATSAATTIPAVHAGSVLMVVVVYSLA
ncbi:baseplate J/gp47 family protein [Escherichia coli]